MDFTNDDPQLASQALVAAAGTSPGESDQPGPGLPASPPVPGLASIIIACWNQIAFTRQCLSSIVRRTRGAFELILVDNGSSDGTAQYFAALPKLVSVRVEVITNAVNRGFPTACNQGMAAARGEYVVLVNNDTIVTDGWLNRLIALTRADPAIGLTGPMSNYVSPPQQVSPVPYRDEGGMHRFARQWAAEHPGQWFTVEKLSGFCLLIKREVIDRIGGLDPRFALGLFDDDDICLRARQAGYQLAVCADLFIHHTGSQTFRGSGIDAEALLAENERRFREKWGDAAPVGRRVGLAPWSGAGT